MPRSSRQRQVWLQGSKLSVLLQRKPRPRLWPNCERSCITWFLSSSVKEGGRRRALLLWGLKCWLLTGGKHSCLSALPQLLSEFSGRRDVRGLVEAAKITFNSGNCDPAVLELQVSALSEAITLEPHHRRREMIGAGAVEILSHLPLLTSPRLAGHQDHLSPVE